MQPRVFVLKAAPIHARLYRPVHVFTGAHRRRPELTANVNIHPLAHTYTEAEDTDFIHTKI